MCTRPWTTLTWSWTRGTCGWGRTRCCTGPRPQRTTLTTPLLRLRSPPPHPHIWVYCSPHRWPSSAFIACRNDCSLYLAPTTHPLLNWGRVYNITMYSYMPNKRSIWWLISITLIIILYYYCIVFVCIITIVIIYLRINRINRGGDDDDYYTVYYCCHHAGQTYCPHVSIKTFNWTSLSCRCWECRFVTAPWGTWLRCTLRMARPWWCPAWLSTTRGPCSLAPSTTTCSTAACYTNDPPPHLTLMYTNQSWIVMWSRRSSLCCNCSNGIKQGGVLSPVLFCAYMDEILNRFDMSNAVCHIGHQFICV